MWSPYFSKLKTETVADIPQFKANAYFADSMLAKFL